MLSERAEALNAVKGKHLSAPRTRPSLPSGSQQMTDLVREISLLRPYYRNEE